MSRARAIVRALPALLVGGLLTLCAPGARAQAEIPDDDDDSTGAEIPATALRTPDLSELIDELNALPDLAAGARGGAAASTPALDAPQEVRDAYVDFVVETYATQAEERRYRVDTFRWQLLAGKVVFLVVLAVVGVGLVLSWRQVAQGWGGVPPPAAAHAATPTAPAEGEAAGAEGTGAPTEFEASFLGAKLKVTSTTLGVVILTVSLAFFYLYLVYVFKITAI